MTIKLTSKINLTKDLPKILKKNIEDFFQTEKGRATVQKDLEEKGIDWRSLKEPIKIVVT